MLIVLDLVLIGLMIISYYSQDKNYIAPSFVFIASFVFSLSWATVYSNTWQLDLNINTFIIIAGGAIVFFLSSYLVHMVFKKSYNVVDSLPFVKDNVNKYYREALFSLFIVITIIITLSEIRSFSGVNDISSAIYIYRNANVYSSYSVKLSAVPYYFGIFVRAAGYWYAYYIGSSIGYKKRVPVLSIIVFVLCLLFSLLSGGRNDLICMLFATLFISVYSRTRFKHEDGQPLRIRTIVKSVIIGVLGIVLFAYLTTLIGRNVDSSNYLYYVAVYCGASIKNLNTFLSQTIQHSSVWGQYTFINLLNYLGVRFNIAEFNFSPILSYNFIGNLELGNVYSLYYAFVKDFGFVGAFFLVALMAIISQAVFELMRITYSKTNIWVIIYGFIISLVALSFFSNKFYETLFDITFIKYLICWVMLNIYYGKERYSFRVVFR